MWKGGGGEKEVFVKVKNLRKRQKIILLIAFIIVFYFMIYPEVVGLFGQNREWVWGRYNYLPINYSDMIMNISIVAVATGIVLFIESWIYSKKKDN